MMTAGSWITLASVLILPIICFIIVVFMGYKKNKSLDRGEMRRAITVFFIILFGLLIAASFFPIRVNLPPELKGLFAGTVATIIGYYFGSRTSESNQERRRSTEQENPSNQ